MSLTPMSKNTLQALKTKLDNDTLTSKIKALVTQIYNSAVNAAKTTSTTSFQYNMSTTVSNQMSRINILTSGLTTNGVSQKEFCLTNKTAIIAALTPLFPNCTIKYSTFGTGSDGKSYDITNVPSGVTLNTAIANKYYIVIDWS
jgi:hypothetical protein